MHLHNVEAQEAAKMMADTDKRRMTNYNFYTEQKWGYAGKNTADHAFTQCRSTGSCKNDGRHR